MLKMNCWSFKDLLDSYLSQELAVETNHAMLRHAEQCGGCRREMAARRQLREKLRRVCMREKMSQDAYQRLHARLRADAYQSLSPSQRKRKKKTASRWSAVLDRTFTSPAGVSVAIGMALLLFVGILGLYMLKRGETSSLNPELSAALFDESAGDHRACAVKFYDATGPVSMPADAPQFDPAYASLDKIAEAGAQGLQLRSAHICLYEGRRFAHLVYTRGPKLISLLVTERDARALKLRELPNDEGSLDDVQRALRDRISLGAYQTAKHIVLVVSDLPTKENDALAQQLAVPVAAHLRQMERTSATFNLKPMPISGLNLQ